MNLFLNPFLKKNQLIWEAKVEPKRAILAHPESQAERTLAKMDQDRAKCPSVLRKIDQDAPTCSRSCPKMLLNTPKSSQHAPETVPEWAKPPQNALNARRSSPEANQTQHRSSAEADQKQIWKLLKKRSNNNKTKETQHVLCGICDPRRSPEIYGKWITSGMTWPGWPR